MFKGHPKGLYALALANTGERFGYYTMLAVFALFLGENFGWEAGTTGLVYSSFLGLVYFMPLLGGIMADKFGFGRMVTIGITIMFLGYLLLSFPLGGDMLAAIVMFVALVLISVGTGLFKGNLQVMVGNLYDDPKYAERRDSGFSLFYMAINVGSLFAPTTAIAMKNYAMEELGFSSNDAYHFSFMVACVALILSIAIYYLFRSTFRHVEGGQKKGEQAQVVDNLTPEETKQRVIALCLVFAVVIFFWMAFHQNGLTLTFFASEFTNTSATGFDTMFFDVWNLALIIIAVYATFSIFQSESAKGKLLSGTLASAVLAVIVYRAMGVSAADSVTVNAPIFQQFNPFYVVALTPVSMAVFGSLARKGKEPSAPRKIAYGMLVAAIGFVVMAVGSTDLNTPNDQKRAIAANQGVELAEKTYQADMLIKQYVDEKLAATPEIEKNLNEAEAKELIAQNTVFKIKYNVVDGDLKAAEKALEEAKKATADAQAAREKIVNSVLENTKVKPEGYDKEVTLQKYQDDVAKMKSDFEGKLSSEENKTIFNNLFEASYMNETIEGYNAAVAEAKAALDKATEAEFEAAWTKYNAAIAERDTFKVELENDMYVANERLQWANAAYRYACEGVTADNYETLKEALATAEAANVEAQNAAHTVKIYTEFENAQAVAAETNTTVDCEKIKSIIGVDTKPETRTSPYWLIVAYLVLTFAELLLSPMGISFVSKVAPPKYKGMMMGCWFVATAIGNMLVSVGGFLWGNIPLSIVWGVFTGLCLLSALFMFVMMKKLEAATK